MIAVTNKSKIVLTGKHVDDVSNDRLTIDFDQRLRERITGTPKSLAEA
jgi:hypothetical protein